MRKFFGSLLLLTLLFTSASYAEEMYNTEVIVGIGATLEKLADGTIQVDALIPNAPAEHSGLAAGDIIVDIKSLPGSAVVDVRNVSLPDAVALIRGPIGVPVEISYTRGTSSVITLSIVREKFEVDDGH